MEDDLISQTTSKPTRKVTAASVGSALAAVFVGGVVWVADVGQPPPGFEAGLGTILALSLGWLVKERSR